MVSLDQLPELVQILAKQLNITHLDDPKSIREGGKINLRHFPEDLAIAVRNKAVDLKASHQMTVSDIAHALGIEYVSVYRWEKHGVTVQKPGRPRLDKNEQYGKAYDIAHLAAKMCRELDIPVWKVREALKSFPGAVSKAPKKPDVKQPTLIP